MAFTERLIVSLIAWLEKELQDPVFVADIESLLNALAAYLETQIGNGTPSGTPPASVAVQSSDLPAISGEPQARNVGRKTPSLVRYD